MSADEKLITDYGRMFGDFIAFFLKWLEDKIQKSKPLEKSLLEESDKAIDKFLFDTQEKIKELEGYDDEMYSERIRLLTEEYNDGKELQALVKSSESLFRKDHKITAIERLKITQTLQDVRDFMDDKDFKYKNSLLRSSKNLTKVLNVYLNHQNQLEIYSDDISKDDSFAVTILKDNSQTLEYFDHKQITQNDKYIEQNNKYIESKDYILVRGVENNPITVLPPAVICLGPELLPLYQDMYSKVEALNRAFGDGKLLKIDECLDAYNEILPAHVSSSPMHEMTSIGIENLSMDLEDIEKREVLQPIQHFAKPLDVDQFSNKEFIQEDMALINEVGEILEEEQEEVIEFSRVIER